MRQRIALEVHKREMAEDALKKYQEECKMNFRDRALKVDLKRLELNLEDYATKKSMLHQQAKMEGYLTLEKYHVNNIDVTKRFNDFEKKM